MIDTILQGDCLDVLRGLPDGIAQACVTSPPYFGLRDYGVPGQLGLEATPDEYVARMVALFREVRRVLRSDGTLWLNIGDSYAADGRKGRSEMGRGKNSAYSTWANRENLPGLKPKDLVGIPWMLAFALRADGWYLRADIIWHKSNPMPESVTDRPTKSHEYLFLLSKQPRYYYDAEAIREPSQSGPSDIRKMRESLPRIGGKHKTLVDIRSKASALTNIGRKRSVGDPSGRNKRSVWTVATAPYSGAHFATFPPALIEPCVLAGSPPRCCEVCGAPWVRVTSVRREKDPTVGHNALRGAGHFRDTPSGPANREGREFLRVAEVRTEGWQPTCRCVGARGTARPIVLDPFFGAGTTGVVARRHSRHYLGIELNPDYIAMAEARIAKEVQPVLWSSVATEREETAAA